MLATHKMKTLEALVRDSSEAELIWINGYLSGLVAEKVRPDSATNGQQTTRVKKATICYGTETGNAKKLALELTRLAKQSGISVACKGLDQYRFEDLAAERDFFVIVSTQGEGEPPEPAKLFFQRLYAESPDLSGMRFSVLALGDTAYPLFCKAGEDLDARLAALGAQREMPVQKCDVDYEAPAQDWFKSVVGLYAGQEAAAQQAAPLPIAQKAHKGKRYYDGIISAHINLNDRGSRKETWHIELRSEEVIDYAPGDAIAIVPENREEVVEAILASAGVAGDALFDTPKGQLNARVALTTQLNICFLLGATIRKYAALTGHDIPDTRMDLLDLLRIYPLKSPDQFGGLLALLSPIAPRLYSVASSPRQYPKEVHLTVGKHRFMSEETERVGLCSRFLGDLPVGTAIRFYVHHNRAFKLPEDDRDIIMIGPGTGVAPFRGFVQDRDESGASGKNWFFFGEQHFRTDFLYQAEWQQYLQTGALHTLTLAFSRDQPERRYVQHRIQESAAEFFAWVQRGASIFISGTKDPMSRDVEQAIVGVISQQGRMTEADASAYLAQMKKDNRYQKDVY
jgi:sulfite reductase (NADPH) flavoprotein alpha-component